MSGESQIKNIYPATPMQAGMIFHSMYEQHSDAYFQQLDLTLSGDLNVAVLEESFNRLIERHDVLRTIFNVKKTGVPLQIVLKKRKLKIQVEDISGRGREGQNRFIKQFKSTDKNKGFDLSKDLLMRVAVIHLDETTHRLIWSHHHILMDGWCLGTIVSELMTVYGSFQQGADPDIVPVVPYHRYIKWLEGRDQNSAKRFWEEQIGDFDNETGIPHNKETYGDGEFKLEKMSFTIPEKTVSKLEQMAQQNQVTLQIVFQAVWGILLQKYNSVSDVVFGNVVSGRPYEIDGIERMIGLFINTVPVRVQTKQETTWTELIKSLQHNFLSSAEFQYFPLYEVQNLSPLKQNLINHILLFENFSIDKQVKATSKHELGFQIKKVQAFEQTNYDFMASITVGRSINVKFSYNKYRHSKAMLEQIKGHLLHIIEQIVQSPDLLLADLSILQASEHDKLLIKHNQTNIEYDKSKTMNSLWRQYGMLSDVAITDGNRSMTYSELHRHSNKLASYLRKRGVQPNMPVGLMVKRSLEMLVGMVGILKSGGAYLPIDPAYPSERISYILDDSCADFLLSETEHISGLDFKGEVYTFDEQPWKEEIASEPESVGSSSDLAYVTYTSGSTGLPKGVAIEHRSVVNFFVGMDQLLHLSADKPVLSLTSMSFDIHVLELLYPLTKGSKIVLVDDMAVLETPMLCNLIKDQHVRVMQTTPSRLQTLLQNREFETSLSSLDEILIGGEAVPPHLLDKVKACTSAVIWNMYGPTETTVWSTAYRMDNSLAIKIGKPIANTKVYILNERRQIVPEGVPGELYIGGEGLARGYLHRPDLTQERFVDNPFHPGALMYRTGDLVKWSDNGNIEYIGRNDKQVKIRGYRIESSEVEFQLLKIDGVKEVAVIAKEVQGEAALAAFCVSNRGITLHEVREQLGKVLPSYMLPSYLVSLAKLPSTPNGKLDKQALKAWPLSPDSMHRGYERPQGEVEEQLSDIWKSLLSIKTVGRSDHFFELGGHSLKAIALVSKIRNLFQAEVTVKQVFEYPVLQQLAQLITHANKKLWYAISPAPDQDYYPVTSAQKRLFILNKLEGMTTAYNMPIALQIKGPLDVERLRQSLQGLVMRHEVLRSSFHVVDGEIVQKITTASSFELELISSVENNPTLLEGFIHPFDLSLGTSLFRVRLVHRQNQSYVIMIDLHHIISDAASIYILTKELIDLYHGHSLQPLPIQYKDYSVWQNSMEQQRMLEQQGNFWSTVFAGEVPSLELPTEYSRPPVQRFMGDQIHLNLDETLVDQINRFISHNGVTPFMFFLSVYYVLLWKYTGQQDIVVGTPVLGRTHENLQSVLGMFVNTLALRNKPDGEKSFEQLLQEIKLNAMEAFDNQDYPFEQLVEKLNLQRDLSRNPLFDTMFIYHQPEKIDRGTETRGMDFQTIEFQHKKTKFDLMFSVTQSRGKYKISIDYCTDLFSREYIERMYSHYVSILQEALIRPENPLKHLSMITAAEQVQLSLIQGTVSASDFLPNTTVHKLFEEQVERTPDQIAVVDASGEITYRELNARANRLARRLKKLGLLQEEVVAVRAERSATQIAGVLAVMKSGGCFLPVDPGYPEERMKYMIDNCSVRFILSDQHEEQYQDGKYVPLSLHNDANFRNESADNLGIGSERQLLYVIYTSGTTGEPKGVMLEHRNIVNMVTHMRYHTAARHDTNVLQYASISFDVCYQELFTTLLSGGKLYVVPEDVKRNINQLFAYMSRNHIEVFYVPTALLKYIFNDQDFVSAFPGCIRHIITAGEQLVVTGHLKEVLQRHNIYLHNHYGPTETHVVTTAQFHPSHVDDIPLLPTIGRPIQNTEMLILDPYGKKQPLLVAGELYISGFNVGRGYVGQHADGKFIPHPVSKDQIMYRTGDLARWLPDGSIEYIGRIDRQMKIRGFRVELGEIEAQLLNVPGIVQAAIKVMEDHMHSKMICAYFVSSEKMDSKYIREFMSKKVPDYMIPAYFIQLDTIPLTINGKTNYRELPEPSISEQGGNNVSELLSRTEATVQHIWKKTLNVDRLGVTDNFFERGGHSLKAMLLLSRIYQDLHVDVPLRQLFQGPTVREMACYIDSMEKIGYQSIVSVEHQEYYPLSTSQKRLFVLDKIQENKTAYHLPGAIVIEGELDIEKLRFSLHQLIQRHEILRTSFHIQGDEAVQCVYSDVEFNINCKQVEEHEVDQELSHFIKPFKLDQAPLLNVGLFQLSATRIVMAYDMHHIISDGISMGIFVQELIAFYRNESLPELRIQYKDFACWQKGFLESHAMLQQEQYWTSLYRHDIPVLDLPIDFPRPAVKSFAGEHVIRSLDTKQYERLKQFALKTNTTVYLVLLTAYSVMLHKYSGQEEIVIGSPVSGRNRVEMEPLIGVFINTLALKTYINPEESFADLLNTVKENTLAAFENQDFPFELLVDKLQLDRDVSRNPLFDTMFVMQNMDRAKADLPGLTMRPWPVNNLTAKFDLSLTAVESETGLDLSLSYSKDLFKSFTVQQMLNHLINIINGCLAHPQKKIVDFNMISEPEKVEILQNSNGRQANYPLNRTLHAIFEEQAALWPDRLAVVMEERKMTYSELNRWSEHLACKLIAKGCNPGDIVAVAAGRRIEVVAGIMAILKAGCAFLPIDMELPTHRIEYMLELSGAGIFISDPAYCIPLQFTGEIVSFDNYDECGDDTILEGRGNVTSNELAYVIFTSGTTGLPKGVMVEHKAVVNYVYGFFEQIDGFAQEYTNFAQIAPFYFDASIKPLFGSLLFGKTMIMMSEATRGSGESLIRFFNESHIHISDITPTLVKSLTMLADQHRLQVPCLLIGGEKLTNRVAADLIGMYAGDYPNYYNVYGPTESCVNSTLYPIRSLGESTASHSLPIGKPLPNQTAYILSGNMEVVPIGVIGELYIGGVGLARGYLHNQELTESKFIPNPYRPSERLYRTGDLAKWLPSWDIEYLGRSDYQVKIRGTRIELQEIEYWLKGYPGIEDAMVIDRTDRLGEPYLCAYIVAGSSIDEKQIKEHLIKCVPLYMIPSYYIKLGQIPFMRNGKVNRNELPEPNDSTEKEESVEIPENELQATLMQIWLKVLSIDRIGIRDNFFRNGGHSLKAAVLVSKIHKELGFEIPLRQIFLSPTIQELASYICNQEAMLWQPIQKTQQMPDYPVSTSQRRMYFLQQLDPGGMTYNMPFVLKVKGSLEPGRLVCAVNQLVERHEVLRTSFSLKEGEPVQGIHELKQFRLERSSVRSWETLKELIPSIIRPFHLGEAPLFRLHLFEMSPEEQVLLWDMHHIISDGLSNRIYLQELVELYHGTELETPQLQYKDYAVWQREQLQGGQFQKMEKFWVGMFSELHEALSLPLDYERPNRQSFSGDVVHFSLGKNETEQIQRLAQDTGSSAYMILLSGFYVLLSKYSGQQDIVVGSPIAGRTRPEWQQLGGLFVNTLALRAYPDHHKSMLHFIEEVKEMMFLAYENQEYPFDSLVDKLNLPRDLSRNPLFDVMFVLQNMDDIKIKISDLQVELVEPPAVTAKHDLKLNTVERNGQYYFAFEYCTSLFSKDTVIRMGDHFLHVLTQLMEDPNRHIADIQLMTEGEAKQLVEAAQVGSEAPYVAALDRYQACLSEHELAIAVIDRNTKYTYSEFDSLTDQMANLLREKYEVNPNDVVAVMLDKTSVTLVVIWALQKLGATYLPIDPEYPRDRINYILMDSSAKILVTRNECIEELNETVFVLDVALEFNPMETPQNRFVPYQAKAEDTAYIIYTSGSTGNPKGVLVSYGNLGHFCNAMNECLKNEEIEVIVSASSISFDASILELIWPVSKGLTVLLHQGHDVDYDRYLSDLSNKKIAFQTTPSRMKLILGDKYSQSFLKSIHVLIIGGEMLAQSLLERIYDRTGAVVYHMYGPTEATVWSTGCILNQGNRVHIGKPLVDVRTYLLDECMNIVPPGVVGEIYIGGIGVASGYLNKKQQTDEHFIQYAVRGLEKEYLYRTGDFAKYMPDGSIEILGRRDQQVKVRGYRIEIGEIESCLMRHPDIDEAAVVKIDNQFGEGELVAYCTVTVPGEHDFSELRVFMRQYLPEYALPSRFIYLSDLPMTPNGKLNRKELMQFEQDYPASNRMVIAPRTETEKQMMAIWHNLFGSREISVFDHFFELGGHSLKAALLVSEIYKALNVELPYEFVFKYPTIAEISQIIDAFFQMDFEGLKKTSTVFNDTKRKTVFCFPPIAGMGSIYGNLAKHLQEYKICGFDFIEHEDVVQEYAKLIIKFQPEGPYVLVGYSAGGNLAYEVAKALKEDGREVSDIIVFDSYYKSDVKYMIYREILRETENQVSLLMEEVKRNSITIIEEESEGFAWIKRRFITNVMKYKEYYYQLQNHRERVSYAIHLIKSKDTMHLTESHGWDKYSLNETIVYQGFGDHSAMLSDRYAQENARILKSILNNIQLIHSI